LTPEYLQTWRKNSGGDEQPPETLPDETVAGLMATKHINAAVTYLRQLAISFFDMEVHSSKSAEELANMDVSATYNKMRREMCHLEDLSDLGEGHSWGHGWAIYPHLMDGYDAGFYSYLL
jgi:metallopeptidase MepB